MQSCRLSCTHINTCMPLWNCHFLPLYTLGQYKTLSRTATHQPSSTVSSGGSIITRGTSDKWWILGGTHTIVVTSCGGEWSLSPFSGKRSTEACCAVLTAPSGVVEEGIELLVEYCVILEGPFSLPSNYVRVSVAVYLKRSCDYTFLPTVGFRANIPRACDVIMKVVY